MLNYLIGLWYEGIVIVLGDRQVCLQSWLHRHSGRLMGFYFLTDSMKILQHMLQKIVEKIYEIAAFINCYLKNLSTKRDYIV